MTDKDRGHYAEKHSPDRAVNPAVAEAVRKHETNREISCAVAFDIADNLQVSPQEVGFTIDALELTIVKCQLGLYGYQPNRKISKPAETVSDDLEQAIREGLVNDRLPCAVCWEIAKRFGLRKMEVSSACEALEMKITPCQLGAF